MPDRTTTAKALLLLAAAMVLGLCFIASYTGALHAPQPHELPVAVAAQVPAPVRAELGRSGAVRVVPVADPRAARLAIARREAYGALVGDAQGGLRLVTAPAAGPAAAQALTAGLLPQLRATRARVAQSVSHPLPAADARGLVGFYTAIGWIVGGYLGATVLGMSFGTRIVTLRTAWRLAGVAVLAVVLGFGGALVASAIGDLPSVGTLGIIGTLSVAAAGTATVALQAALGLPGTALAILAFVVVGNPSAGGAFPFELLPEPWRTVGPALPNGAATTALRDAAYFPDASLREPAVVLVLWIVAGAVVALAFGRRARAAQLAIT